MATLLALTAVAANYSYKHIQDKMRVRFDQEVSGSTDTVVEQLRKYENSLWAGVGAIRSHEGPITRSQWRTFARSLKSQTLYSGIDGIGVIEAVRKSDLQAFTAAQNENRVAFKIHPENLSQAPSQVSLPIVYIEPEVANRKLLGLDVAQDDRRFEAANMARDTGQAKITAPMVSEQDTSRTPVQFFYAPYYKNGTINTVSSRRRGFLGFVFSPVQVDKLVAGALKNDRPDSAFRLSDNGVTLFSHNWSQADDADTDSLLTRSMPIELYGRTWSADFRTTPAFRNSVKSNEPFLILIAGTFASALLLCLFWLQARAVRKTLEFAERQNASLRDRTLELDEINAKLLESNADLESFAYVASHDLKTPLRGIRDLTSYLEEDLADYIESPASNPDVKRNIKRLWQQTKRMDGLILGILNYARADSEEELGTASLRQVAMAVATDLNVRNEQLSFGPGCPVFETYAVRFHQVIANIVDNAFKHHSDRESALVSINCRETGAFYEISVSDNGPGIDAQFYDSIFEAFETLDSKDKAESIGIGLAIVKKTTDSIGGSVMVESQGGEGTTFTVLWPMVIEPKKKSNRKVA